MIDFNKLVIRLTQLLDLPIIAEIEQQQFAAPWSQHSFASELVLRISECVTLLYDREIIGYAITWFVDTEAELAKIALSTPYQKMGVGTWFLQQILQNAKKRHVEIIKLEVRRSNQPALNLYKKAGFIIDGIRTKYYAEENEDALLMSLNIKK